jgi:hypothetical protein
MKAEQLEEIVIPWKNLSEIERRDLNIPCSVSRFSFSKDRMIIDPNLSLIYTVAD